MKFKVEIGEELLEYQFDQTEIIIGSDPSCHISLAYEGVGQNHIRVFQENNQIYLQDLNSGHGGSFNGEPISPGAVLAFEELHPLEMGGIYIYCESETPPDLPEIPTGNVKNEESKFSIGLGDFEKEATESAQEEKIASEEDESAEDDIGEFTAAVDVQSLIKQLNEESEEPVPPTDDLVSSSNEDTVDKSDSEKRAKFKPDLFSDSMTSDLASGEKKSKTKKKVKKKVKAGTTTRKVNVASKKKIKRNKNFKRRVGKRKGKEFKKKKTENNNSSLRSKLIVFVGVLAFGFIFYNKYWDNNQNQKKNEVVETKKDDYSFEVSFSGQPKIEKSKKVVVNFINNRKCQSPQEKALCEYLGGESLFKDFEGVKLIGKQLAIGLDVETLAMGADSLFNYLQGDRERVDEVFQKDYSSLITYDQFKGAGDKIPFAEFKTKKEEHANLMIMIRRLINPRFQELISGIEINNIIFLSFKEFENEVKTINMFKTEKKNFDFQMGRESEISFKLKTFWNALFTNDIETYISQIGETEAYNFSDKIFQDHLAELKKQEYFNFLNEPKCEGEFLGSLCDELRKVAPFESVDGTILKDNKLFVFINPTKSEQYFRDTYIGQNLTKAERGRALALYRRLNPGKENKEKVSKFQKQGHRGSHQDIKPETWNTHTTLSVVFEHDFISLVAKNKEEQKIMEIAFICFRTDDEGNPFISEIIEIKTDKLNEKDQKDGKMFSKLFWRSTFASFDQYLKLRQ